MEVKNGWSCTSIPSVCLQGVESDNFTFAMGIQEADYIYSRLQFQLNC